MSIEAMKQALEALEWNYGTDLENIENCTAWLDKLNATISALRQAIAEAEKIVPSDHPNSHQQEPFAVAWVLDGELFWPSEYEVIAQAGDKAIPLYTAPVHASDISQKPVDETAKREREWVGLDGDIPGLGLVTEEFYNGMLCAEDILRKRNT